MNNLLVICGEYDIIRKQVLKRNPKLEILSRSRNRFIRQFAEEQIEMVIYYTYYFKHRKFKE